MPDLHELRGTFPSPGRVDWIGLSPARRGDIEVVASVQAEVGTGLRGDHHASSGRSKRQVTLIQAEHLAVVAALVGHPVAPADARRNVSVSGINVSALRDRRFRVGGAVLEGTGPAHPCSRMEETLGPGGYNAMRGHGGITARVVQGGRISVGDDVRDLGPTSTIETADAPEGHP